MSLSIDELERAIKKEKDTRKIFDILLKLINEIIQSIEDLESKVDDLESRA